jgi:hypothetical protein
MTVLPYAVADSRRVQSDMANIATSCNFAGHDKRAGRIVRQFGPNEAEVIDLLRCAGRSKGPSTFFQAAGWMTLSPATWTAGLFIANELRGVVLAGDVLHAGRCRLRRQSC